MKHLTSHITETGDGYDQTKAGLIRKRGTLTAEIQALQQTIAQKTADLRALEATIRIFDPDVDMEGLPERRIPPAYAAFRGEMARFFLGQLRNAPHGMTTHELTLAIMADRCMDSSDKRALRLIHKRTGHSLLKLRGHGFARSEKDDPSGMLRWWVAAHHLA
jgi:hypothetical protein